MLPGNNTAQEDSVKKFQQEFRSHVGVISRQSGVFFAGTMFTAVASYLFKIYVARMLGSEALGIYALGMTVAGLFGVFGGLGLNWATLKFPQAYATTGRMEELRVFMAWSMVVLIAVNGVLAAGVVLARSWVVKLYHAPALAHYLYLFAFILFLGSLTNFFGQTLTGFKRTAKRTIITNFVGLPLTISFAVLLISIGTGLWGYIVAQVASASVVLGLLMWAVHKHVPLTPRFGHTAARFPRQEVSSFATAAFVMELTAFLYSQADKIILGSFLKTRMVGIYAVAATIVAFIPMALQSVNQIFAPTIAELHARGEFELLDRLYQTLTKWVVGLTVPLAVVVVLFARVFMRIFGHDFEAGWIVLVIGTVGQLANCGTGSVGQLLLMSGNEKRLLKIQNVMAVVTVVACLSLVPRYGITGTAIATAACNVATNVWCLLQVKKWLHLFPYNRSYWILVLPSLVTVAVALGLRIGLRAAGADFAVLVFATIVAYCVFIGTVLLQGLKAEDRMIASAIWARIRGSVFSLRPSES